MEVGEPLPQRPTEEEPDQGTIRHKKYDLALCDVLHWVDEDGVHVLRAADFDLLATGDDHDQALYHFVDEVFSLFDALGQLVERDEATPDEMALFVRIGTPIIEATRREIEGQEKLFIDIPRLRRRGNHRRAWRSGSSRAKPSRLSTV